MMEVAFVHRWTYPHCGQSIMNSTKPAYEEFFDALVSATKSLRSEAAISARTLSSR